jgi:signal transduction histidine kinase
VALVGALTGKPLEAASFNRTAFLLFPPLFTVIPLVLVVVLVRYRLWEVERVVSKALVYGVLAAFVSTVYVLVVAGIGAAVGSSGEQSLPLSIAATAIVAVAFDPLRRRLQRVANVLVYGHRASPADVVQALAKRMSDALSVEETLPALVDAAGRALGAAHVAAEVPLPGGALRSARWPLPPEGEPDLDAEPGPVWHEVPVHHHGLPVGTIRVAMPEGEALDDEHRALLEALARQAGPALRNVQLAAELEERLGEISAQAAELRASRQRIVAAQDAAARRLERDLHDGAQQQLVAIAIQARLARQLMRDDPERAELILTGLQTSATETLADVRDLAHGIYPPLLAQEGLRTALESQARRSAIPVLVEANGLGRFAPEAEAAVYFCTLEALQNTAKYAGAAGATVRLSNGDGRLSFTVTDDGAGFDPAVTAPGAGLRNMEDRLAALGGALSVTSSPGGGTSVEGWVPVEPLEPARHGGDG